MNSLNYPEAPDYRDPFDDIDQEAFYWSLLPFAQRLVIEAYKEGGDKARTEKLREFWHNMIDADDEYQRENRIF